MGSPNEKQILPSTIPPKEAEQPRKKTRFGLYQFLIAFLFIQSLLYISPFPKFSIFNNLIEDSSSSTNGTCQQADPIYPKSFNPSELVKGEKEQIIGWLSGAVKVPTETFDVMGEIGEDERWDVFYKFADCESSASASSFILIIGIIRSGGIFPARVSLFGTWITLRRWIAYVTL